MVRLKKERAKTNDNQAPPDRDTGLALYQAQAGAPALHPSDYPTGHVGQSIQEMVYPTSGNIASYRNPQFNHTQQFDYYVQSGFSPEADQQPSSLDIQPTQHNQNYNEYRYGTDIEYGKPPPDSNQATIPDQGVSDTINLPFQVAPSYKREVGFRPIRGTAKVASASALGIQGSGYPEEGQSYFVESTENRRSPYLHHAVDFEQRPGVVNPDDHEIPRASPVSAISTPVGSAGRTATPGLLITRHKQAPLFSESHVASLAQKASPHNNEENAWHHGGFDRTHTCDVEANLQENDEQSLVGASPLPGRPTGSGSQTVVMGFQDINGPEIHALQDLSSHPADGTTFDDGDRPKKFKTFWRNTKDRFLEWKWANTEKAERHAAKSKGSFRPNESLPEEVEQAQTAAASDESSIVLNDQVLVSNRADPVTGRWFPLDIMMTNREPSIQRNGATWKRHYIRPEAPLWITLLDWPWRPRKNPDADEDTDDKEEPRGRWEVILRANGAWLLLLVVVYFPYEAAPEKLPFRFAPLLYKYEGYAKSPRNKYEKEGRQFLDDDEKENMESDIQSMEEHQRCLWPSLLTKLASPQSKTLEHFELYEYSKNKIPAPAEASSRDVEDVSNVSNDGQGEETLERNQLDLRVVSALGEKQLPKYLFVSYATQHFRTKEERMNLVKVGEYIARERGLEAIWSSALCVQPDQTGSQFSSEVYKMSDIIRSASEVIIVLPPGSRNNFDQALEEWGSRVWTFPEVLLSKNFDISVYEAPKLPSAPAKDIRETRAELIRRWANVKPTSMKTLGKYEIAERAWPKDKMSARQLIDHYVGTIHLSRLELSLLALRCMRAREIAVMLPGDISYVIMGLHRLRPIISRDPKDTPFQAFARLSLVGDNDRLLERAIAFQTPVADRGSWLSLADEFGCNLWDINPECEVAGVCDDDTVILDGAYGAAIRWNTFPKELSYISKDNVSWILNLSLILLIIDIVLFYYATGIGGSKSALAPAIIILLITIVLIFLGPLVISFRLARTFLTPQPWLLGFEGHMSLQSIERKIFGRVYKQLCWSPNGSTLSVHERSQHYGKGKKTALLRDGFSRCVGLDPASNPKIRNIIDDCDKSVTGADKIFTIVDTTTLQATLIKARKPPVAAVVVGSEGGMKRAVLCSYDVLKNTLYKETVMRLETPTVDKMFRVNRFKFGYEMTERINVIGDSQQRLDFK